MFILIYSLHKLRQQYLFFHFVGKSKKRKSKKKKRQVFQVLYLTMNNGASSHSNMQTGCLVETKQNCHRARENKKKKRVC